MCCVIRGRVQVDEVTLGATAAPARPLVHGEHHVVVRVFHLVVEAQQTRGVARGQEQTWQSEQQQQPQCYQFPFVLLNFV